LKGEQSALVQKVRSLSGTAMSDDPVDSPAADAAVDEFQVLREAQRKSESDIQTLTELVSDLKSTFEARVRQLFHDEIQSVHARVTALEEAQHSASSQQSELQGIRPQLDALRRSVEGLNRRPDQDSDPQVRELSQRLEAEQLYRRGCEAVFGTNGFCPIRCHKLGLSQLQQAADFGHADAQFVFARCCRDGVVCGKNLATFARYARMAAEQHHSYGESQLAVALTYGLGVERDAQRAVQLARSSAEQGNAMGESQLGRLFELGLGVEQDLFEAVRHFQAAAAQGNSFGQLNLGLALFNGRGTEADVSTAVDYMRLAAEQGNPSAQYCLAEAMAEGSGIARDPAKAARLMRKAADAGFPRAQFQFGDWLEKGLHVPKSQKRALEYYKLAADQDDATAKVAYDRLSRKSRGR
jgi:TPR repeat protein